MPQVSFSGNELGSEFNRGMELFNKEKYPAAIRLFDSYMESSDESNIISLADAEYYAAFLLCRFLILMLNTE